MIFFIPTEGLANRIRSIDSMVQLCDALHLKYKIYWGKDEGLNCSFSNIWQALPNLKDEADVRYFNILFKFRRKYSVIQKILLFLEKCSLLKVISDDEYEKYFEYEFKNLNKYNLCIVKSFSIIKSDSLLLPQNIRYARFSLTKELKNKIDFFTKDFPQNIVGIHIRRTDNKEAIAKSPLESFIKLMKKLIEKDSGLYFYLATDSIEVRNIITKNFGEKIIVSQGELSRNSEEGIQQSIIEMYALAQTKKIYGSYYSSYSETAALIGGIELEIVT